jgi:hypothetical protein
MIKGMITKGQYRIVPLWEGKSRVWHKDNQGYYQVVFEGDEKECDEYLKDC